tara:strand:- start:342 stop:1421 length:1080 start_codon:yes stop_codon:yes gene_type:complete
MTFDKLRIGLLGCGRISKNHLKSLADNNDRCELVALCDNSHENIQSAYMFYKDYCNLKNIQFNKILLFSNYEKLLNAHINEKLNLDLLSIATPSGLHYQQTIAAASHKINVCTEKPMALKVEEAEEMIRVCNKNNVKLFEVKQNRLNPTLKLLRSKVKNNHFGQIAIVNLNLFWHRPQTYYDNDAWRGTINLDGGALMNQGIHYVDLLDWIIGPVESVFAHTAKISRDIEAEDSCVLNIKWRNGILGTMAVTMVTYPNNLEGSITIIGDKGTAKVGGKALNKFEYYFFDNEQNEIDLDSINYQIKEVYGNGHNEYYSNMLDVLLENAKPICTGKDGIESLKIINAAYLSSKSGNNIFIK